MADIPKLPDFIRRRITQAMNEPVRGMTLGDGKVRVLSSDLNYMLQLIDALHGLASADAVIAGVKVDAA